MHWSQFSSDKYYIVPFPSGRLQSSLFFFVSSFPQLCGVLCMASRRLEGRQIGPVSSVRDCVLNVKVIVGAFNQEKALEGAFSVIVKLCVIFGNLRFEL